MTTEILQSEVVTEEIHWSQLPRQTWAWQLLKSDVAEREPSMIATNAISIDPT